MDFLNLPRLAHLLVQLDVSLGWMWGTVQEHKMRMAFQCSKLALQMQMTESQEEKIKVMQMRNQLFEQWQVTEEQMGLQKFKAQDKSYSTSTYLCTAMRTENYWLFPSFRWRQLCSVAMDIPDGGERYNIWYSENSLTMLKLLIVFTTTKCGRFLKGYM